MTVEARGWFDRPESGKESPLFMIRRVTTWTLASFALICALVSQAPARAEGRIVVADEVGHAFSSPDGISWEERTGDSDPEAWGTARGSGIFIASVRGMLASSSDGKTWKGTGPGGEFFAVAFGNGRFVAVGRHGRVATSTDGAAWRLDDPWFLLRAKKVVGEGGVTVALNDQGRTFLRAEDGSWHYFPQEYPRLLGLAFGAGTFVGVGEKGTIVTSRDGMAWTARDAETDALIVGVDHAQGVFAACTLSNAVLVSADAITWQRHTVGDNRLTGITCGGPGFLAWDEKGTVVASADGVAWRPASTGTEPIVQIVPGGGFAVARSHKSLLVSRDGFEWEVVHQEAAPVLVSLARAGGTLAVGGAAGEFLTSTDGRRWDAAAGPYPGRRLHLLGFGEQFIAVSFDDPGGAISPDGAGWTQLPRSSDLFGVAFGGGVFVSVGDEGTILRSSDGMSWSRVAFESGNAILNGVAFDGGRFFAISGQFSQPRSPNGVPWSGRILISPDGAAWSTQPWERESHLFHIATVADAADPISPMPEVRRRDQEAAEKRARQYEELMLRMQRSMDFFGQVIDQHGAPVDKAVVKVTWFVFSPNARPSRETQETAFPVTDAQGRFELHVPAGNRLHVGEIVREGFAYERKENTRDSFFRDSASVDDVPDREHPAVFRLRRQVDPVFLLKKQYLSLRGDAGARKEVRLDIVQGRFLKMEDTRREGESGPLYTDTVVELRCPDPATSTPGQLVYRPDPEGGTRVTDTIAYAAPAAGYLPEASVVITPAITHRIPEEVQRHYLLLKSRGPGVHSRLDVEVVVYDNRCNAEFTTWTNPYGGRSLEPRTDLTSGQYVELMNQARKSLVRGVLAPEVSPTR